jgi:hypothetical protein
MHQDAWEAYASNEDKTEWLHQKSLELIKKGYDSDEAYIIACKLMGKARGVTTQSDLDSYKKEKK